WPPELSWWGFAGGAETSRLASCAAIAADGRLFADPLTYSRGHRLEAPRGGAERHRPDAGGTGPEGRDPQIGPQRLRARHPPTRGRCARGDPSRRRLRAPDRAADRPRAQCTHPHGGPRSGGAPPLATAQDACLPAAGTTRRVSVLADRLLA